MFSVLLYNKDVRYTIDPASGRMWFPVKRAAAVLFAFFLLSCVCSCAGADGGPVIVSLGDSYSGGEGLEPFYGQDAEMAVKCQDPDWLAHRSGKCWPGMLTLPGVEGTMKDHRGEHWFLAAASGADSHNLFLLTEDEIRDGKTAEQEKEYSRDGISGTAWLAPQLDIFDELDAKGLKADYVTVTIGGNDIGFKKIVTMSMMGVTVFYPGDTIQEKAESLMKEMYERPGIRARIKRAYTDTAARAGSQACIIVAGYPSLMAPEGCEGIISAESAQIMNAAGVLLNAELQDIAEECRAEGINIRFVSVAEAFDGHGAYSDDPYINPVIHGPREQDLKIPAAVSIYSMHPNAQGVEAYARCVQEVIDLLEAEKTGGR